MMPTVYDFVSPFDLKNCKSRLARRTEKTSLMASKYARRTQVDVWDINKYTVGFKVYKAPRSSLTLNMSWFSLQVTGKLQHRPDGGTVVVYQVGQNLMGKILEGVGAVGLGIVAVLILHNQVYDSFLSLQAMAVFVIVTAVSVGFTTIYRQFTRSELISTVRKSLGDLDEM
ncbi:MAG: hypothetical protein Q9P01_09365 [Anaerolineae bacterium]|nr:hypothetical protein [Anaerolineae bacterium]MDQ7035025.1 hypothetical protein [Anaerolineae bacterium]